jgi:hypothetical protein
MLIIPSDICSAFDNDVIGSKVVSKAEFSLILCKAVEAHDFTQDRVPGQGFIQIPEAIPFVSSGVGHPTENPDNYVLRCYRGRVSAFLKREYAAPVESCAVVVYTKQAYLNDPDITPEEAARVNQPLVTHVLVAVLASSGPKSELSPHRFTANLAGGNLEAQVWTADEIRAKARLVIDYDQLLVSVADNPRG